MAFMAPPINLNSVSIVLVRPKFAENVGSVARAMKNTGLGRLVVVNGISPLHANAYKLASGAEDILERAEEYPNLEEAVSEMGWVVGMTSRPGRDRGPLFTPRELVKKLLPFPEDHKIGLIFGSEKEGLTNEELSRCRIFVKIPASKSFPSLNLAQAVMVVCYELFQSSVGKAKGQGIVLAPFHEVEKMFDHMETTLSAIGFLEDKNPTRIVRALRGLFGRCGLQERDVQILQGIWSKMDWNLRARKRAMK
jgi:tRNA/rRNA methyltransferase